MQGSFLVSLKFLVRVLSYPHVFSASILSASYLGVGHATVTLGHSFHSGFLSHHLQSFSLCRSHITCQWASQQCAAVFLTLGMPQAMSPPNTEEQLFNSTNIYGTANAEQHCVGTGTGSEDIEGIRDIKAQKSHRQVGLGKAMQH